MHDIFVILGYNHYITFQLTVVPSIQFGRVPRAAVQSAWASLTATTLPYFKNVCFLFNNILPCALTLSLSDAQSNDIDSY